MAQERKEKNPSVWNRVDMRAYKKFLLKVSADPEASHTNPLFGQEISPEIAAEFSGLGDKLDDDYEKASQKGLLRLILKKMDKPTADMRSGHGAHQGADSQALHRLQVDVASVSTEVAKNKTEIVARQLVMETQLGKLQETMDSMMRSVLKTN
jgi:hypothetical protein